VTAHVPKASKNAQNMHIISTHLTTTI